MYSRSLAKKRVQEVEENSKGLKKLGCLPTTSPSASASVATTTQYSAQSRLRTHQWVQQHANTQTVSILNEGSMALIHPDRHMFRDYNPVGSIYVRK